MRSAFLDSVSIRFPEPKPRAKVEYDEDDEEEEEDEEEVLTPEEVLRRFPFTVPSIRALADMDRLEFHPKVTFFVGENGSGKSTLLEAIADIRKLDRHGGNKNYRWDREYFSELRPHLVQSRVGTPAEEFFLRAESYYDFAHTVDNIEMAHAFGVSSLLNVSHGESFLALITRKLEGKGLYLFDEPEAALSVQSQLTALAFMKKLCDLRSQFIIATHSPILLAYPDAWIYRFSEDGIERITYEESDPYVLTKAFVDNPQRMLRQIFGEGD